MAKTKWNDVSIAPPRDGWYEVRVASIRPSDETQTMRAEWFDREWRPASGEPLPRTADVCMWREIAEPPLNVLAVLDRIKSG